MSERFTKFKSNYVMRSRHQTTDLGTVMERDWVTTNGLNVLRFGAGRRVWYNSGNFVFTTSNIPTYHKKHKLTTETQEWTWDDCKDADDTVNTVRPNLFTNDIRKYVYYGSCVELIRATIEEIITDFPGRIVGTSNQTDGFGDADKLYIMSNDFNIDIYHGETVLGKYDNELRFMGNSWDKYCIENVDGTTEDITNFDITFQGWDKCTKNNEGMCIYDVTINSLVVHVYYINGNFVYLTDNPYPISIRPKDSVIEEYFLGLRGFKAQLLRQDTKPFYSNKFITPVEFNFRWYYPEKMYIWPSNGYCININGIGFTNFVNNLIEMGEKFDELWTDNIYRSMTHESIKNFDWTYSRGYYEGEEQDNIYGGERMMKILRIFGRVFDDIKAYIDTIQYTNNITYDKIKNQPEALMSDSLDLKGVSIVNTIGGDYNINSVVSKDFLNTLTKEKSWIGNGVSMHKKWYQTKNSTDVYPDIMDNEFMRRFNLSASHIMRTKGTKHSIEMIMGLFGFGDDDFTITEEAYYVTDEKDKNGIIRFDECIDGKIDGKQNGADWTKEVIDWTNVTSHTKGKAISEINANKDLELLYYNDPFSGVPLNTILLGHENIPYIVPYYKQNVVYDGNLAFQGMGGWGKNIKKNDTDTSDDCFDYQETLSYLKVATSIGEMLSLNPHTVKEGDIYYVLNLENYTEYDAKPPYIEKDGKCVLSVSHYFVLVDPYTPNKFSSWRNIVVKPKNKFDFDMVEETDLQVVYDEWDYKDYTFAFKNLVYLENIVSTNVGNNPHVGYGIYDDGKEYIEYMKKPFKYSIDRRLINDFNYESIAELVKFDINHITDEETPDCKLRISLYKEDKDGVEILDKKWFINTKVVTIESKIESKPSYKVIKDFTEGSNEYHIGDILDENKGEDKCVEYYLFDNYFKTVILPYLMQVVPSTTILKLKNFEH